MALELGVFTYDVPKKRKSAYAKIKRKIRRKSIMQTWSAYLFPWGIYEEIKEILENLNVDDDGLPLPDHQKIRYSIFKYDTDTSGDALIQSAKDSLNQMIKDAKNNINKMLIELQSDEDELEEKAKLARNACGKAKKIKEDVEALALVFNLTDDLKAGILAFHGYILAKQKEIKILEDKAVGQTANQKQLLNNDSEELATESIDEILNLLE